MAFSFNWAGLVTPSVSYGSQTDTAAIGANAGKALRGYRDREAARQYGDTLDAYRRGMGTDRDREAMSIMEEISRLEAENAQIAKKLSNPQPEGPQEVKAVDVVRDPALQDLFGLDTESDRWNSSTGMNGKYTIEQMKAIQRYIGMPEKEQDGKLGPVTAKYIEQWRRPYFNYEMEM